MLPAEWRPTRLTRILKQTSRTSYKDQAMQALVIKDPLPDIKPEAVSEVLPRPSATKDRMIQPSQLKAKDKVVVLRVVQHPSSSKSRLTSQLKLKDSSHRSTASRMIRNRLKSSNRSCLTLS